ncbi:MAG: metalloregulator ArsR/SmtB family transcription factor [Rhodoglobus sp.]
MVNNRLDAVYSALADPTRRQMVERLRGGPMTVTQLAQPLTMTLAAVGKHISVLEEAGILRTQKQGRVRSCAVVPAALADATAWIEEQNHYWNDRVDSLTRYLEENP